MKDSIVKLKLVEGAPMIGKLEVIENTVIMEILVPGVDDGKIEIEADNDFINIKLVDDYPYTDSFSITLKGELLVFKEFNVEKVNGVIYLEIPVLQELEDGDQPIKYTV